jgi:Domain of unknown function (DUF4340)
LTKTLEAMTMNEMTKTLAYAAVAVVLLCGAWFVRPNKWGDDTLDDVGQKFFPEFTNPLDAESLEIVDFDQSTATLKPFRVAKVNGVWSIPSHEGYPADAQRQLGQAAAAVVGLEKLGTKSDNPADHELYGVVEPDQDKLAAGATGVGKRVTLEGKNGDKLAQLIIGKADEDKPELHYVRVPGQDRVYVAKVPTEKLSTKFEDWIEPDLLKLNAFDVKRVTIKDHSLDLLRRTLDPRAEIILDFDSKDSKWSLAGMKVFEGGPDSKEVKLADDEELDSQKLNDLKTALDDLKIVDVARKPAELSADLRGGEEAIKNQGAAQMLAQRGFAFGPSPGGGVELYATEGDVRCGMNNGVEYLLRFGAITGRGQTDDAKKTDGKAAEKGKKTADDDATEGGANRYVLVTTRFNQDLIPKPQLKPLPAEPAKDKAAPAEGAKKDGDKPAGEQPKAGAPAKDAPKADTPKAAAPKADAPKTDAPKAAAPKTAAPKAAAPKAAAPKADSSKAGNPKGDLDDGEVLLAMADVQDIGKDEPAKKEPAKGAGAATKKGPPADAAAKSADAKKAGAKPADAKKSDAKKLDGKTSAETKPAETKPAATEAKPADAAAPAAAEVDVEQERKQIEADNKRLQDDYDAKVKEGKAKVEELNKRFADWYYVISDKTFQKIHLNRDSIVKKKTKPAGQGDAPQDFDALKNALPPAPK